MNRELVDQVVKAVLYEGYLLYPYRPSSVKNRQRWTFGGLFPKAFCEAQPGTGDKWEFQTECLLTGVPDVDVRVRFLHLLERPGPEPWQEAVEREVAAKRGRSSFSFRSEVTTHQQWPVEGMVEVLLRPVEEGLHRVTVRIANLTPLASGGLETRAEAQRQALASTHVILHARGGELVSSIDPPEALRDHVASCRNVGLWPVMVGAEGDRDCVLASPIILYDYPQVAPESPGDLFDATEIDEILTLRILTMTDDEKTEMAAADDRARALLQRTESLARDQLSSLHGTIRQRRPVPEGDRHD